VKVAVIWLPLTTKTLLTAITGLFTVTVVPDWKFVPARVTGTDAPGTPPDGLTEVRVGAGEPVGPKLAVSLMGPFIVTLRLWFGPV
jgi:hypothetical protein